MKKLMLAVAFFSAMSFCSLCVRAEPVQFDTDDAHVIVIRPIDSWAGNRATDEYSLEDIRARRVSFIYVDMAGKKIGGYKSEAIFPWGKTLANDAVVHLVADGLGKRGFKFNGLNALSVEGSMSVEPSEMPKIMAVQNDLFKRVAVSQGNPATLADRNSQKRAGHTLIAVALMGVGADKMGTVAGSNFALSSGIADDVAGLTLYERNVIVSVQAVPFDFSQYKSVDLRRVVDGQKDRLGQIIIAYKGEKTKQAEDAALAQAIVTASGADTTVEAIEESRKKDQTARQAIWDECVAQEKCKDQ